MWWLAHSADGAKPRPTQLPVNPFPPSVLVSLTPREERDPTLTARVLTRRDAHLDGPDAGVDVDPAPR